MEWIEGRAIPLESYFIRRLEEEARRAKAAAPGAERSAHERACKLLRELLKLDISPDFHLRHDA
jgi:hypothetical protein